MAVGAFYEAILVGRIGTSGEDGIVERLGDFLDGRIVV
jgi:hypothetical protein